MKFCAILAAFAALASVGQGRTALRTGRQPNRYPSGLDKSYNIIGKNKLDSIWDTTKLREALAKEALSNYPTRQVAHSLQCPVDSNSFLDIVVPAGCVDCVLSTQARVLSSAQHTEFQYRDDKPFTNGEVTMSGICLTPQVCKGFKCPHPLTQKLKGDETFGWSESACCEPRFCKDEVTCSPTSQWEPRKDFDTRMGSTPQACCTAKFCPSDFCDNITGWEKHPATGLKGSSKEECCIQKECMDWTCSDVNIMKKKKSITVTDQLTGKETTLKGWSDVECCEEKKCDEFKIPKELKSLWKLKDKPEEIRGVHLEDCCDPLLCSDFTCPKNTEWRPKVQSAEEGVLAGSTEEECCEPLFCSAYTCSNTRTLQKKVKPEERPGSTDEECCEEKFCKDYKCTKWKGKEGLETIQGSTKAQCCEPVYCSNFTCDTDDDGDGEGTMWYKKMDTNAYKWPGSTNEECCVPKYCSQYTTSTPTQWKRKPQKDALGSTDVECYDQLWCSDYCCVGAGWVKKPEAGTRPGSTDAECCTPGSEAEDLPDLHIRRGIPVRSELLRSYGAVQAGSVLTQLPCESQLSLQRSPRCRSMSTLALAGGLALAPQSARAHAVLPRGKLAKRRAKTAQQWRLPFVRGAKVAASGALPPSPEGDEGAEVEYAALEGIILVKLEQAQLMSS
ncbi:hypothetical protein AK812_SmicGene7452 [Symbiodinium microadriaticum]|uniref:Uncharacterized protein n=1 Tax=Symbiodinium microadriaticum TaxID=2951 RepID=A0A1Q9ENG7_SYMMI|nr:hypothetical protein AK812_SmicGene7452 [Symbiodinium microadriaticum]CAE7900409.1 unnamed protein product [Symbiodinium microadriaticum]